MSGSHRNSGAGHHTRAAVVKVDDSGPQQLVEMSGLAGQHPGETVRSQHFGLSSNPPPDSEGVMLMLGGGADRVHALGMEHPDYRPRNLPVGGTIIYEKDSANNYAKIVGDVLTVSHKTKIVLKVGGVSLTIDSGGFHFAGGSIDHEGHLIDRTHVHTNAGGAGLSGPPP